MKKLHLCSVKTRNARKCYSCRRWRNFICVRLRHETPENVIFHAIFLDYVGKSLYMVFEVVHKIR